MLLTFNYTTLSVGRSIILDIGGAPFRFQVEGWIFKIAQFVFLGSLIYLKEQLFRGAPHVFGEKSILWTPLLSGWAKGCRYMHFGNKLSKLLGALSRVNKSEKKKL